MPGKPSTGAILAALVLVTGCHVLLPLGPAIQDTEDTGPREQGAGRDLVIDVALTETGSDPGCRPDAGTAGVTANLRSIGSRTTALLVGNASCARGSPTVTFAGGTIPDNVGVGDQVSFKGSTEQRHILSRDSATRLTLQRSCLNDHLGVETVLQRAHNSLPEWETARGGDLVADGRREIGICYDDGPFTEALVVEGSTTDALHYLHLTVAPGHRHLGRPGAGVVLQPDTVGHGVWIKDPYTRVEWLEVTGWATGASGTSHDGVNIVADGVIVDHLLVHHDGGISNPDANGIAVEDDGVNAWVRNSIVFSVARSGITIHGHSQVTSWKSTLHVEGCTVWRCLTNDDCPDLYGCIGIHRVPDSKIVVHNVIAVEPVDSEGASFRISSSGAIFDPASGHNISSDDTTPGAGAGSLINVAAADLFVAPTGDSSTDLHLKAGSPAVDQGISLSPGLTDIDGQCRPVGQGWDIGADER